MGMVRVSVGTAASSGAEASRKRDLRISLRVSCGESGVRPLDVGDRGVTVGESGFSLESNAQETGAPLRVAEEGRLGGIHRC